MSASATAAGAPATTSSTRWVQLALGLVCMMAIASPQYVWALFTKPLGARLGAAAAAIQVTFSLLIVIQTFLAPPQGWLVDRFGPRLLISVGALLSGLSWVLAGQTSSLTGLYLSYGLIGGIGTGIVYIGVVGQMVAWFPERRGFAAGAVAAGYGMGAIVTTFPIAGSLAARGDQATLTMFGIIFAVVGVLAAQGLKPAMTRTSTVTVDAAAPGTKTRDMLRHPIFWLMFAMMTMMSTSGLMVTSQLGNIANEIGVAKMNFLGFAVLPSALFIDRLTNGLTRPFFGWVSDQIGREPTMAIAFTLEGVAMALWLNSLGDPVLFVLLSGIVFFGWGEIFSLFPSTLTDTFGAKDATLKYGWLYIAQGVGSVLGAPLASLLHGAVGSWGPVFWIAIAADLLTATLAIVALRPMRRAYAARMTGA